MKKNNKFRIISVAILLVTMFTLTLGTGNLSTAQASDGGVFQIQLTHCNSQENPTVLIGFSNDCVFGPGDCIDNSCPEGAWEVHTPQ